MTLFNTHIYIPLIAFSVIWVDCDLTVSTGMLVVVVVVGVVGVVVGETVRDKDS